MTGRHMLCTGSALFLAVCAAALFPSPARASAADWTAVSQKEGLDAADSAAADSEAEAPPGVPDLTEVLHPQGSHYRIVCQDMTLPERFGAQIAGYKDGGEKVREKASRVTRLKGAIGEIEIDWTVLNAPDEEYQAYLDQELSRVDELNAEDRIDLFTVGTNLLPKYCQGDQEVAMTAGEIGLSESDLVSQFEPLRTLAKGADGEQRAVTYELPVCAWVYRRSIAKEVLGTDDPSRVGAAVQNWDAFEQTAAKMKTSGYQMYSSWMELYDICAAEVSAPWVDEENALRFDDAVVEWIRRTRSDAEKGYVHGSERGSEEWVADMAKNSRVFGFCLTPAEIRTTLAGTDSGKAGDWAVTGGPGSCLDGASWLCAAAGSDNKELTKRVMQTLTTGEESMMDMLTRTGIAVNNRSVMEQAASDRTLTNAVLGGENPFGIWLRAAGKVSVEHRTDYDDGLKQILEASYLPYFKGETDEQSALGNFYAAALTRYPDLLT